MGRKPLGLGYHLPAVASVKQLDILDDDPRRLAAMWARANRIQAETAMHEPFFSEQERQRRAEHYTRIAEQHEQRLRELGATV